MRRNLTQRLNSCVIKLSYVYNKQTKTTTVGFLDFYEIKQFTVVYDQYESLTCHCIIMEQFRFLYLQQEINVC